VNNRTEAEQLDAQCELSYTRSLFNLPEEQGKSLIYFCGNSLGLQLKSTSESINRVLHEWQSLGVEAWWQGSPPWLQLNQELKKSTAAIVGSLPEEVVTMNSLTINMHLLLASFYKPQDRKRKVLIESDLFPSDLYALQSHLTNKNIAFEENVIRVSPRTAEFTLRTEDVLASIERHADELAMVWWSGINYKTGQYYELKRIAETAQKYGITVGLDLAHAVGNVPLQLHDWGIDCATWCTYKYLNGGPGAVAQAFIHKNHYDQPPALTGWWGVDSKAQFLMQDEFIPARGADAYQISTSNILSMAALHASLSTIDEIGIDRIFQKQIALSTYLIEALNHLADILPTSQIGIITPESSSDRGAQISISFGQYGKEVFRSLSNSGVVVDWREPNIIRVAPSGLYNTYTEIFEFIDRLRRTLSVK